MTGPIGRLVRLGFAAVIVLSLGSIVRSDGSARFRNPHILTEPSAWLLHLLMLMAFVLTVGAVSAVLFGGHVARRIQVASFASLVVAVGVAGAVGYVRYGSLWGFPLADLVWYFDVVLLVAELAAFSLAVILGTPGCEIGVWPELISRARGRTAGRTQGLPCIIGIHLVDRWEANRRATGLGR
jgi:hypothetical protein